MYGWGLIVFLVDTKCYVDYFAFRKSVTPCREHQTQDEDFPAQQESRKMLHRPVEED